LDTQAIEGLTAELGIPLPAHVARARATLDALSVLDVPLHPVASAEVMASRLRAMVERGEAVTGDTVIEMARAKPPRSLAACLCRRRPRRDRSSGRRHLGIFGIGPCGAVLSSCTPLGFAGPAAKEA
jgi:hypothetical protein